VVELESKSSYRPVLGVALVSLLVCGLAFPLVVTGVAQGLFPSQANGEMVTVNGRVVGSALIAQGFSSPMFFHARNESQTASGVDPDIGVADALGQVAGISGATGIPQAQLQALVTSNEQGTLLGFGSPYVDVLSLNVQLIQMYPSVYSAFG
jgi:potassium-transporting ATPase KdpC subunit